MVCSEEGTTPVALGAQHGAGSAGPEIGLGVDAGGTYTDAVIYCFRESRILAKAKALTTKWNYIEGIEAALDQIPSEFLHRVGLVSVSTTLATNAIVENHGQKVGVLLMPPYGRFQETDLAHTPKAIVQGQMDMDGTVLVPVNPSEIELVAATMVREHGVRAFAVSGCGATINAAHELEVMEILQATTGLSVTCGHVLSDMLGMYERAATAIFNARVVPFIEVFLDNLQEALAKREIVAPVMVVKGDGTMMSTAMAKEKPVETIFSGPAASVAGAKRLTNLPDALVVDIGGTTTDIAAIRDNRVEVCAKGNIVAGTHTHVRALNMTTRGLGGDSAITVAGRELLIGPKRVIPVSLLATQFPGTSAALDYVEADISTYRMDTGSMQLLALTGHNDSVSLSARERSIVGALAERPYSIDEIAQLLSLPYRGVGAFSRLLDHHIVSIGALTPTDLLHAAGRMSLWDRETAVRMCHIYAQILRFGDDEFLRLALDTFTRELALELLRKVMGNDVDPGSIDSSRACKALLSKWLAPADGDLSVGMHLPYPMIGVGAPAAELLPGAAALFNTRCIIPSDYDVANAVGAITSTISISRTIRIAPKENGRFAIMGLADGSEFADLGKAVERGKAELVGLVRGLADKAGVLNPEVETTTINDTVVNGYGDTVFLATIITASVTSQA